MVIGNWLARFKQSLPFAQFSGNRRHIRPRKGWKKQRIGSGLVSLESLEQRVMLSVDSILEISATDAWATESMPANPDTATFTITRSGDISDAISVGVSYGGTATNGVDYSQLSESIAFAPGQTTAILTVTPSMDFLPEGNESVIVSLTPSPGQYTLGNQFSASATIADEGAAAGTPMVSISATDPFASEVSAMPAMPDTGSFTLTRTGDLAIPLTVSYSVSGTATAGVDYSPLTGTVSFMMGQSTASITVTALPDANASEGNESVVVTLLSGPGYEVGTGNSASLTIIDGPSTTPTVTVSASDPYASEVSAMPAMPDTGTFTITRTGDLNVPLSVSYSLSGTASSGVDYSSVTGVVSFYAGQSTATVVITPLMDALPEGDESVVLTLLPGPTYQLGTALTATVMIADGTAAPPPPPAGGLPSISLTASDSIAAEQGIMPAMPDTGSFTLTRTGDLSTSLTVNYSLGGTATNGIDYMPIASSVTFAPMQSVAVVSVMPIADGIPEGTETIVLTLIESATYTFPMAGSSATINLSDTSDVGPPGTSTPGTTGTPTVTISASDPYASEVSAMPAMPDTGTFTITRTGDLAIPITVSYSVSGTATAGADFSLLTGTVSFMMGQSTASITVTAIADANAFEGNESVVVTLLSGPGYEVGTGNSASLTIIDGPSTGGGGGGTGDPGVTLPLVTIYASDATASEENATTDTAAFTLTRTGDLTNPLSVSYTLSGLAMSGVDYIPLSGSVMFMAGQATTTITVTAIADADTSEGNESVNVTLVDEASYDVGTANSATIEIINDPLAGGGGAGGGTGGTGGPGAVPTLVTVAATDAYAAELNAASETGTFTFTRTGDLSLPLTISYTVSGTATSGVDYYDLGGSVVFMAGQSTVSINVVAKADTDMTEGTESVIVTVLDGTDYDLGAVSSASVSIADNTSTSGGGYTSTGPSSADIAAALAAAQARKAAADADLVLKTSTFLTAIDGIDSTWATELNAAKTAYDTAMAGHEATFDTNIAAIKATFESAIATPKATYDAAKAALTATFESDLDNAKTAYEAATLAASSTYSAELALAQADFDTAIASANTAFETAEQLNWDTYNTDVASANAAYDVVIAGATSIYDTAIAAAQAAYDTAEAGYWSAYEAAVGTSGLLGAYNSAIAAATTARDAILAAHTGVTYDTSLVTSTTAYTTLVDTANAALQTIIEGAVAAFDTAVQGLLAAYDTDVAGIQSTYDSAVGIANTNYETAATNITNAYNTAIDAAVDAYNTDVDGYLATYDTAIDTADGGYDTVVALAQSVYDTSMQTALDNWNTTVDNAIEAFNSFLTGGSGGTTTVDRTSIGGKWVYSISSTRLDGIALGLTVEVGHDLTAFSAGSLLGTNPFTYASQLLTAEYLDDLNDSQDDFNTAMTNASGIYDTDFETATTAYMNAFNGINGTYQTALALATSNFTNTKNTAQTLHDQAEQQFHQNNPMLAMSPPPDMTPLYQIHKDLAVTIAYAEAVKTDAEETAYVAFVTQERAIDNTLTQALIDAGYDYSVSEATASRTQALANIATQDQYLKNLADLFAEYDRLTAGQSAILEQQIADADRDYLFAKSAADELLGQAKANAQKTKDYAYTDALDTYTKAEASRFETLRIAAAGAEKTRVTDLGLAEADWYDAEADAYFASSTALSARYKLLSQAIDSSSKMYTAAVAPGYITWVTNVSTGLADQMIELFDGSPDRDEAIAIANAWRDFDIANAGAWQTYITGESTAWEVYSNQELSVWQTAYDAYALADRDYTHAVTPGYATLIGNYASAGENYVTATAPLDTVWTGAFSNAENAFYKREANAYRDFDWQLLSADKVATDAEVTAAHDFVNGYIPAELLLVQDIIDGWQDLTKDTLTEIAAVTTGAVNAGAIRESSNMSSMKSALTALVPVEDDSIIANSAQTGAHNAVKMWDYTSDLEALSVGNFITVTPTNAPERLAIEPLDWRYEEDVVFQEMADAAPATGAGEPRAPGVAMFQVKDDIVSYTKNLPPGVEYRRVGDDAFYHIYADGGDGELIASLRFSSHSPQALVDAYFMAQRLNDVDDISSVRTKIKQGYAGVEIIIRAANEPLDMIVSTTEFVDNPNWLNAAALLPGVPGGLKKIDDIVDAGKAVRNAEAVADAVRIGHVTPWSNMTAAERRAFQHSYSRHARELGLPNWQQSKAADLQKQFNNVVGHIRTHGTLQPPGTKKPFNGAISLLKNVFSFVVS